MPARDAMTTHSMVMVTSRGQGTTGDKRGACRATNRPVVFRRQAREPPLRVDRRGPPMFCCRESSRTPMRTESVRIRRDLPLLSVPNRRLRERVIPPDGPLHDDL